MEFDLNMETGNGVDEANLAWPQEILEGEALTTRAGSCETGADIGNQAVGEAEETSAEDTSIVKPEYLVFSPAATTLITSSEQSEDHTADIGNTEFILSNTVMLPSGQQNWAAQQTNDDIVMPEKTEFIAETVVLSEKKDQVVLSETSNTALTQSDNVNKDVTSELHVSEAVGGEAKQQVYIPFLTDHLAGEVQPSVLDDSCAAAGIAVKVDDDYVLDTQTLANECTMVEAPEKSAEVEMEVEGENENIEASNSVKAKVVRSDDTAVPKGVENFEFKYSDDGYHYYTDKDGFWYAQDSAEYWYSQDSEGNFVLWDSQNNAETSKTSETGEYHFNTKSEKTSLLKLPPESATASLLSKSDSVVKVDEQGIPQYPRDNKGRPTLPIGPSGFKVFPLGKDGNPLFPIDKTGEATFPIGDDEQPVFPVGANGKPIVPISKTGKPIFPMGKDGKPIFPLGQDGRPTVPVAMGTGKPVVPLDDTGKHIVPYDSSGQPLIIINHDGTPVENMHLKWNQKPSQLRQPTSVNQQWPQYYPPPFFQPYNFPTYPPFYPPYGYVPYGNPPIPLPPPQQHSYAGWQNTSKTTKKVAPEEIQLPAGPSPKKPEPPSRPLGDLTKDFQKNVVKDNASKPIEQILEDKKKEKASKNIIQKQLKATLASLKQKSSSKKSPTPETVEKNVVLELKEDLSPKSTPLISKGSSATTGIRKRINDIEATTEKSNFSFVKRIQSSDDEKHSSQSSSRSSSPHAKSKSRERSRSKSADMQAKSRSQHRPEPKSASISGRDSSRRLSEGRPIKKSRSPSPRHSKSRSPVQRQYQSHRIKSRSRSRSRSGSPRPRYTNYYYQRNYNPYHQYQPRGHWNRWNYRGRGSTYYYDNNYARERDFRERDYRERDYGYRPYQHREQEYKRQARSSSKDMSSDGEHRSKHYEHRSEQYKKHSPSSSRDHDLSDSAEDRLLKKKRNISPSGKLVAYAEKTPKERSTSPETDEKSDTSEKNKSSPLPVADESLLYGPKIPSSVSPKAASDSEENLEEAEMDIEEPGEILDDHKVSIQGINNEKIHWSADIVESTVVVPILQYSCKAEHYEEFRFLKQKFDDSGGVYQALHDYKNKQTANLSTDIPSILSTDYFDEPEEVKEEYISKTEDIEHANNSVLVKQPEQLLTLPDTAKWRPISALGEEILSKENSEEEAEDGEEGEINDMVDSEEPFSEHNAEPQNLLVNEGDPQNSSASVNRIAALAQTVSKGTSDADLELLRHEALSSMEAFKNLLAVIESQGRSGIQGDKNSDFDRRSISTVQKDAEENLDSDDGVRIEKIDEVKSKKKRKQESSDSGSGEEIDDKDEVGYKKHKKKKLSKKKLKKLKIKEHVKRKLKKEAKKKKRKRKERKRRLAAAAAAAKQSSSSEEESDLDRTS